MKKLCLLVTLFVLVIKSQAQIPERNPFPKTITVAGSAEMNIVPDEIFVNIQLTEYQKKGSPKKDLEAIKTQFMEACKASEIADSLVSIVSYSGFNNYYNWKRSRRKDPDLFATVTYQVKFKNSKVMDQLVEKLDDEATKNFSIVSTSHSKMTEFRRQLKIQAIKAAKDKGIYLTEAISEKLGEAITINETDVQPVGGFYMANGLVSNNAYSQRVNTNEDDMSDNSGDVDFKKIKLRFEVSVVFALK